MRRKKFIELEYHGDIFLTAKASYLFSVTHLQLWRDYLSDSDTDAHQNRTKMEKCKTCIKNIIYNYIGTYYFPGMRPTSMVVVGFVAFACDQRV